MTLIKSCPLFPVLAAVAEPEHKAIVYEMNPQANLSMAAESQTPYGSENNQ